MILLLYTVRPKRNISMIIFSFYLTSWFIQHNFDCYEARLTEFENGASSRFFNSFLGSDFSPLTT